MRWYQHAAPPVDAIFHDNEIVLAGELVLIYTMQAALLGRAAQAVAVWQKASILWYISWTVHDVVLDVPMIRNTARHFKG